jgi:carotenoid cleavage dioxygenase
MKPWPDNAFLKGYYEPLTTECTAPDLVIEGEIPKDLNGTFYRNGPNPPVPPKNDYHFFTGDGMVHAFPIHNGRVSHKNRWARRGYPIGCQFVFTGPGGRRTRAGLPVGARPRAC